MGFPSDAMHLNVNEVYPRQTIYGFQLEPAGCRLAFVRQSDLRVAEVTEQTGRKLQGTSIADLYLLASAGGYPQQLTDTGDFSNPAIWSPDGAWLACEHGEQLWVMAPDGGQRRLVYRGKLYHPPIPQAPGAGALGDALWGYPRWSPDGASILIAVREGLQTILRLVCADGKAQRDLYAYEGLIIGWDWSPDGHRVVCVTRNEDGWTGAVRIVDVQNGETRALCEEDHYAYLMPVAAWAGAGRIVFRSNRTGWAKLWLAAVDSVEITPLTVGAWDDYGFRVAPDGEQIVYASRAEQAGSGDDLWLMPSAGGQPARLTRHGGINAPLAWSRGGEIFYWHADPMERGDVWAMPAAGGEPKRLTWNTPLDLARKLRAPQEVVIPNEGVEIPTLIYLPVSFREGERYPAIVWIHGGPTMVARTDFAPYCHWLANQGYVVLVPNYRGSVGYGVAHMNAVAGEGLGKHDLSDVLAAGRYARTLPTVDLRRGVGVGGRSWGGYLTLMAVTQAPDDFSCALADAAISDWFIQQAGTEVRYYDRWLIGGWVYEQSALASARSPINFATRLKAPLLVLHGENDTSVPFQQIEAFVARARQAGAAVDFVSYPLEGHSNRDLAHQQDALERTKTFFRRHLQAWNLRDNPSGNQVW